MRVTSWRTVQMVRPVIAGYTGSRHIVQVSGEDQETAVVGCNASAKAYIVAGRVMVCC